MKKYIFATLLLFILSGIIHAQQKKSAARFSSINSIGLLSGQSQTTFTMQSINGIKYKSWFAGLGAGLDTYGYRSIPAFADIRKSFGKQSWQAFVYADGGINFPLYSSELPRKLYGNNAYKLYNTFYGEAGIGFNKPITKKTTFILSAGFSYKHFSYLDYNYYNSPFIFIVGGTQAPQSSEYNFYYRRIAVKMGIAF